MHAVAVCAVLPLGISPGEERMVTDLLFQLCPGMTAVFGTGIVDDVYSSIYLLIFTCISLHTLVHLIRFLQLISALRFCHNSPADKHGIS